MKPLLSYKEGKVKLTLQKAMMSQTDVLSTQRAGRVNPGKETLYPLCRTVGGHQDRKTCSPPVYRALSFPHQVHIYYILSGFNTI